MATTAPQPDYDRATVAQLVEQARAKDGQAFGELFQRYRATAFKAAARYLGFGDETEDLVQDAFLHAFLKLDQLKVPAAFGGWIRVITSRMAINKATRGKKLIYSDDAVGAAIGKVRRASELVVGQEEMDRALAAVRSLSLIDREALELRAVHELSYQEIAERLGCPLGTAKRRIHVARKRVKRHMPA